MFFDEFATTSLLVGIVVALCVIELVGVSPGGLVVVGFLVPQLGRPLGLFGTLVTAVATFLIVRFLGRFLLLYGRRRLVLVLLLAIVIDALVGNLVGKQFEAASLGFASIGRVVPGLLANAMDSQGFIRTLAAMALALSITGLLLVIVTGILPVPAGRNIL